jgi:hypothetical protein
MTFRFHGVTHESEHPSPVAPVILIGGQSVVDAVPLRQRRIWVGHAANAQNMADLAPRQSVSPSAALIASISSCLKSLFSMKVIYPKFCLDNKSG